MSDHLGIVGADLWALRHELSTVLGGTPVKIGPRPPRRCRAIVGWCDRPDPASRAVARVFGLPLETVAEGPLGPPRPGSAILSLRLNRVVRPEPGGAAAASGLEALLRFRVAARNDGVDELPGELDGEPFVLIALTRAALRDGRTEAALRTLGRANRLAFVADGRGPPSLAAEFARRHPGAVALTGVHPWGPVERAARILAPAGEISALALATGRSVEWIGPAPPGADDPERVFADRYLGGVHYLDAWSRAALPFEAAAEQAAWLRARFLDNGKPAICIGVSRWKQGQIARFLDGPGGTPRFLASPERAIEAARAGGGRVVAWETRMPRRLDSACRAAGVPLLRMEDGFLRSVGLGAAFLPGASSVLDERGIYYDPRGPSDLEHILATADFHAELVRRAAALRGEIVALRLSKYNVGAPGVLDDLPGDRPIVLVPGQVEDDASVLLGSPAVPGNRALLEAARRGNPDAYLIFKPHPDVEAGLRQGRIPDGEALRFVDRVVARASIVDLIDRVDAVETMTSLAGFEALMRGRRVVVHGRPFYAGWGLTTDRDPIPRRTRRLALDELVAGALILYPRYVDPVSGLRCPPEALVRRLAEARDAAERTPASAVAARAAYVRARHALLTPLGRLIRRARGAVRDPSAPSGPDSA